MLGDDLSFAYESVLVAEYLPILKNIINDLNAIHALRNSSLIDLNKDPGVSSDREILNPICFDKNPSSIGSPFLSVAESETSLKHENNGINSHKTVSESWTNTDYLGDYCDGSHVGAMNSQSVAGDTNIEDSLREDNKMLKEELDAKIKEIEHKAYELIQKDESLRNLQEQINRETKNDDQVDQKYTKLLNAFRKKNDEMLEKTHKINDLEYQVEDLKMKCGKLEKKYKTVTTNLESLKQDFEECEKEKDEYQENYKSTAKEIKKLKKVSINEENLVKIKNELKSYKQELRKKDDELKQHENLVTELKQANESMSKDNENSKEKLDELEKCKLQIKEITKALEEKNTEIAELKEEYSENCVTKFTHGKETIFKGNQGYGSITSKVYANQDGEIGKSELEIKEITAEEKSNQIVEPTEQRSSYNESIQNKNFVTEFKHGKETIFKGNQRYGSITSRFYGNARGEIGKSELEIKEITTEEKPKKDTEPTEECSIPVADTQGGAFYH